MVNTNIKKYREANNMSQEELAESLKVTINAVDNWESGKTQPDIHTLHNIAKVLNISVEELIYETSTSLKQIDYDTMINYLCKYGTVVHAEFFQMYQRVCPVMPSEYYYDHGCVIVADNRRYNIHQVTPDAQIEAVTAEYVKSCENTESHVDMFYVSNGDLPPELDKYLGWRNFARQGEKVPFDSRVRELTENDSELIRSTCAPYIENDTRFGKRLAWHFYEYIFTILNAHQHHTFGIFYNNALVGIATSGPVEELGIAWLCDIFIIPEYRKKGYGKALIRSALSAYPDKKWCYQAARDNTESIALAKSLGFTLEGAGLHIR